MYCNGTSKLIVGGDIKETTLDGLVPNMSYSITVRAYQDIIGPPSTRLDVGKYFTYKCLIHELKLFRQSIHHYYTKFIGS